MHRLHRSIAVGAVLGAAALAAGAQDRMDLEGSKIIGNRELPKVLYILPWKKPTQGELSGRPLVSVLDEAMAPVDRDVFRRQVSYDGQTQAQAGQAKAAAPATPAPAK